METSDLRLNCQSELRYGERQRPPASIKRSDAEVQVADALLTALLLPDVENHLVRWLAIKDEPDCDFATTDQCAAQSNVALIESDETARRSNEQDFSVRAANCRR